MSWFNLSLKKSFNFSFPPSLHDEKPPAFLYAPCKCNHARYLSKPGFSKLGYVDPLGFRGQAQVGIWVGFRMSSAKRFLVYRFLRFTRELHKKLRFAETKFAPHLIISWKNIKFEIIRLANWISYFTLHFGIEKLLRKGGPGDLKTIFRVRVEKLLRSTDQNIACLK